MGSRVARDVVLRVRRLVTGITCVSLTCAAHNARNAANAPHSPCRGRNSRRCGPIEWILVVCKPCWLPQGGRRGAHSVHTSVAMHSYLATRHHGARFPVPSTIGKWAIQSYSAECHPRAVLCRMALRWGVSWAHPQGLSQAASMQRATLLRRCDTTWPRLLPCSRNAREAPCCFEPCCNFAQPAARMKGLALLPLGLIRVTD